MKIRRYRATGSLPKFLLKLKLCRAREPSAPAVSPRGRGHAQRDRYQ